MVTISGYSIRQNVDGKSFCTLTLLGGIELVESTIIGQFYATARKASITSTFPKEVYTALMGTTLPGIIEKVESEPYEYTIKETNETIMLSHKFIFNPTPNEVTMGEAVFGPELAMVQG
ncbi:MAG: hypothetical protein M0Q38_09445 [Bacteroidales bacterium]|jgi:hypothetical protein|nr:hypothetical protein [Bacteroidales bacterium]